MSASRLRESTGAIPSGNVQRSVLNIRAAIASSEKADIPHSQEKVLGHRLTFVVERQNFTEVEFEECNFHNKHGDDVARIGHLTFDRCKFRRSFMGIREIRGVQVPEMHFHEVRLLLRRVL